MIATMFSELKAGDRFYYENNFNPITHFSNVQINEIQKITIAKLICDNLDVIRIQTNPFLIPNDDSNPMISCESIPEFNYSLFTV
jgi:peroxidase